MNATAQAIDNLTLNVTQEIHVRASLDATFAALLEEIGPHNAMADGKPMPMKIEPWPGGRWYRDLGDNNGHFWGHVQAIKRPTLLEITGPLFMSYPVVSNVQYRLSEADGGTLIKFQHAALGLIPDEHQEERVDGLGQTSGPHARAGGRGPVMTEHQVVSRSRVAGRAQGSAGQRKGIHAPAGRAQRGAPQDAVGEGGEELRLRCTRAERRRWPICLAAKAS